MGRGGGGAFSTQYVPERGERLLEVRCVRPDVCNKRGAGVAANRVLFSEKRAQHRIASTHQHPICMGGPRSGTTRSVNRDEVTEGVTYSLREFNTARGVATQS